MASIFVTGSTKHVGEFFDYPRYRILESHSNDAFGCHRIASNPDEADVVLFATNYSFAPVGLGILTEIAFRRNTSRSVLFDSGDAPSPVTGGSVHLGRTMIQRRDLQSDGATITRLRLNQ